MIALYILLALVAVLYLWGCRVAYVVTLGNGEGDSDYTRRQKVILTLGSWATVVIGLIGRVQ